MKRLFVLFIAMVYFAVSSGFTLSMHYCMGHFVDASFTNANSDGHECKQCGMTKKKGGNGCCHDEHKIIKSDVDHALVKQLDLPAPAIFALLPVLHFPNQEARLLVAAKATPFRAHAPPEPDECPLFLKMRNLRI